MPSHPAPKHVQFRPSRSPAPRAPCWASPGALLGRLLRSLRALLPPYAPAPDLGPLRSILKNGAPRAADSHHHAYDIVDAAIRYGCVNHVVEKVGDYFLFRKVRRRDAWAPRRPPTPGPEFVRCPSCQCLSRSDGEPKRSGSCADYARLIGDTSSSSGSDDEMQGKKKRKRKRRNGTRCVKKNRRRGRNK